MLTLKKMHHITKKKTCLSLRLAASCCSRALQCHNYVVFQVCNILLLLLPVAGIFHLINTGLVTLAMTDLQWFGVFLNILITVKYQFN